MKNKKMKFKLIFITIMILIKFCSCNNSETSFENDLMNLLNKLHQKQLEHNKIITEKHLLM